MHFKSGWKFWLSALFTLAWMAVIFLFSSENGDESSATSGRVVAWICGLLRLSPSESALSAMTFCVRKAAHMTEFGLLGLLAFNTLRLGFGKFSGIYPLAFCIASLYAATDELHQLFIADRSGQFTDWLIDSAGILLWLTLLWLVSKIISSLRRQSTD